jgi:hypothetical protein
MSVVACERGLHVFRISYVESGPNPSDSVHLQWFLHTNVPVIDDGWNAWQQTWPRSELAPDSDRALPVVALNDFLQRRRRDQMLEYNTPIALEAAAKEAWRRRVPKNVPASRDPIGSEKYRQSARATDPLAGARICVDGDMVSRFERHLEPALGWAGIQRASCSDPHDAFMAIGTSNGKFWCRYLAYVDRSEEERWGNCTCSPHQPDPPLEAHEYFADTAACAAEMVDRTIAGLANHDVRAGSGGVAPKLAKVSGAMAKVPVCVATKSDPRPPKSDEPLPDPEVLRVIEAFEGAGFEVRPCSKNEHRLIAIYSRRSLPWDRHQVQRYLSVFELEAEEPIASAVGIDTAYFAEHFPIEAVNDLIASSQLKTYVELAARRESGATTAATDQAKQLGDGWIIAVMELTDPNASDQSKAIAKDVLRNMSSLLRNYLAQRGAKTVDRSAQTQAAKLESYRACFDESCQIELGRALAASHILRAELSRFGQKCILNAELVDLRTEVAVAAASANGACDSDDFLKMAKDVSTELNPR